MKYPRTRKFSAGDGYQLELQSAPPSLQFIALSEVVALLGPSIAGIVSGGGVRLSDATIVPWAVVLQFAPETVLQLATSLLGQLDGLDGRRMLALGEMLLLGRLTVAPPGGSGVLVETREQLDALLPDGWAVAGAVRVALELNLTPTSAGGGGGRQPARQS